MKTKKDHWPVDVLSAAVLLLAGVTILSNCSRQTPSGKEVWAEVDGKPIYRDQVERFYRARMATGSNPGSPEQSYTFKLNILNELINNQVLVAHALRSRLAVSEAEVDTQITDLQSPYSKEEFQKKLVEQGLEMGDLRNEVRQTLIINKLINKEIVSRITVSEAEISDYYNRNKAAFNVQETQYHLAQIQVTAAADPQVRNLKGDDAKTPQAAERKIKALYARLRTGEDFATVAQEYSEDTRTAAGGGDMGFIPASSFDSGPGLKNVIVGLQPGQITGILRAGDSFHVFKLLGREEAGQRELTDPQVQSAIRQTLTNEREQLVKAAFVEDLRNRAKVVDHLAGKIVAAAGHAANLK